MAGRGGGPRSGARGMRIFTLGVGTPEGEVLRELDEQGNLTLRARCARRGGEVAAQPGPAAAGGGRGRWFLSAAAGQ
jgi:hypothetical protein